KWPMSNIVKQHCYLRSLHFLIRDFVTFASEISQGKPHKVHSPDSMVEAGMQSSGVYKVSKSKLFYSAQPLKPGMVYDIEYKVVWDSNKSVDRVVKYFLLIQTFLSNSPLIY